VRPRHAAAGQVAPTGWDQALPLCVAAERCAASCPSSLTVVTGWTGGCSHVQSSRGNLNRQL
jgi:hypothetical protein